MLASHGRSFYPVLSLTPFSLPLTCAIPRIYILGTEAVNSNTGRAEVIYIELLKKEVANILQEEERGQTYRKEKYTKYSISGAQQFLASYVIRNQMF